MTTRPASLIVDGSNLLCRNAFALRRLTLNDDEATPCGGAWGLVSSIVAAIDATGADQVHVCWDGGRSPRRMRLLPTYKGNRGDRSYEMEKVWAQAPMADGVLKAAGAYIHRKTDVEADDIISLLARAAVCNGRDAIVVSNDGDFLQLIDSHSGIMVLTEDARLWKWGSVAASLVGEPALTTKCLMGCSSDNIPGIKGIGLARAAALRDAVQADAQPWCLETLQEIALGNYVPPCNGDRNIQKATDILRSGHEAAAGTLVRNRQLCDLSISVEWPEVFDACMLPEFEDNPGENYLEMALAELDWKIDRFATLAKLWE